MPSYLDYNPGMKAKLADFRARTVYRVVTVLQAPFMMKDATGIIVMSHSTSFSTDNFR
jgi:hypothetical protein